MALGLSKGIRLSRDSVWERSLSHRGAGRAKAFSHVGKALEMSGQKESHRGFHSCISLHTSLSLPFQGTSKCHQPDHVPRVCSVLHISSATTSSKTPSLLSSTSLRSSYFLLTRPSGLLGHSPHTASGLLGHSHHGDPFTRSMLPHNPSTAHPTQGKSQSQSMASLSKGLEVLTLSKFLLSHLISYHFNFLAGSLSSSHSGLLWFPIISSHDLSPLALHDA